MTQQYQHHRQHLRVVRQCTTDSSLKKSTEASTASSLPVEDLCEGTPPKSFPHKPNPRHRHRHQEMVARVAIIQKAENVHPQRLLAQVHVCTLFARAGVVVRISYVRTHSLLYSHRNEKGCTHLLQTNINQHLLVHIVLLFLQQTVVRQQIGVPALSSDLHRGKGCHTLTLDRPVSKDNLNLRYLFQTTQIKNERYSFSFDRLRSGKCEHFQVSDPTFTEGRRAYSCSFTGFESQNIQISHSSDPIKDVLFHRSGMFQGNTCHTPDSFLHLCLQTCICTIFRPNLHKLRTSRTTA